VLHKFGESEILAVLPPVDFDPLKATDEELDYYGLPARPTDPEQYKRWAENVGNKKYVGPSLKAIPVNEVFGDVSLLNQEYDPNSCK
jgi:hypothetical protein